MTIAIESKNRTADPSADGETRGYGKRREECALTGLRAECLSLAGWPEYAHIGQSLRLKRSAEGADGYAGLRKPAL